MSQVEEIAQWIKFLHEVQTLCKSARHGSMFLSIIRLLKRGKTKRFLGIAGQSVYPNGYVLGHPVRDHISKKVKQSF